jgi:putative transposase
LRGSHQRSDRGVQYRAIRYTERLAEAAAVASVGSRGDSYDTQAIIMAVDVGSPV